MGKKPTKKSSVVASDVFPPVQVTSEQTEAYTALTTALLEQTVTDYDHFFHHERRCLSKKHWKPVKSRENVTVYKQKHHRPKDNGDIKPSIASSSSSSSHRSSLIRDNQSASVAALDEHDWQLPMLLGVGTIPGTLKDVMYGIATPDTAAMRIKMAYVHHDMVDGAVLYCLEGASVDNPFRFLGIKWFVKAHPAGLNAVVWPRDCVYLESTGIVTNHKQERIGFHIMHSIERPECRELMDFGILRGRISSCALYRELDNGTVDVYMKSLVEPHGKLVDAVAILSAAESLIGCWKMVSCAQSKKLAYLLARRDQLHETKKKKPHHSFCSMCNKNTKASFRSGAHCQLCDWFVCHRCSVTKSVCIEANDGSIQTIDAVCCKNCIYQAIQYDAEAIVRQESGVVAKELTEERHQPATAVEDPVVVRTKRSKQPSLVLLTEEDFVFNESMSTQTSSQSPQCPLSTIAAATIPELPSPAEQEVAAIKPLTTQEALWMQMTELRVQAETIYQLTKKNTEQLLQQAPANAFQPMHGSRSAPASYPTTSEWMDNNAMKSCSLPQMRLEDELD